MAHRNPLHRHRDPPWQKPKEWTLNRPEEAFPPERFQIGIAGEIISEWWAISFRNAGRFGSESASYMTRAAEKLREHHLVAQHLAVFMPANRFNDDPSYANTFGVY